MNLVIINHDYHYELENLVRLFFPNEKIEVTKEKNGEERFVLTELQKEENGAKISVLLGFDEIFSGEAFGRNRRKLS